MQNESKLVDLAIELAMAKHHEREARDARVRIEEAIVAATGFVKPEGSQTFRATADGHAVTVTLKQPVITNVDGERWLAIRRTLPAKHAARAVFRQKWDIDTAAARKLQNDDPKAWADVAPAVTRKPGKVSVEIKEVVSA